MAQRFGAAFEALQNSRPVVIAAINGCAMGGGLECALACDLRIAAEQAQMALPEASVGLLCCGCGTQTLPWLVGEGWAKRMILTNERVAAETALRIGLVEQVVARGQARAAALALERNRRGMSASRRVVGRGTRNAFTQIAPSARYARRQNRYGGQHTVDFETFG